MVHVAGILRSSSEWRRRIIIIGLGPLNEGKLVTPRCLNRHPHSACYSPYRVTWFKTLYDTNQNLILQCQWTLDIKSCVNQAWIRAESSKKACRRVCELAQNDTTCSKNLFGGFWTLCRPQPQRYIAISSSLRGEEEREEWCIKIYRGYKSSLRSGGWLG